MELVNLMAKKFSSDKEVKALSLPEGKRQEDYYHKTESGFGIRVTIKKKTWFIMYSKDGKRKRLTLDTPYPLLSLAEAKKEAMRRKADIIDGNNPALIKQQAKASPTFFDICTTYLNKYAVEHKKASSVAQDMKMIHSADLKVLHDMKAHEITGRDIVLLLDKTSERAPILANRQKALLHKIFKFTLSRHDVPLLTGNPVAGLPSPSKEKARSRVYSDEEIKALWKSFDSCRRYLTEIFKLLLLTGQRSGEVVGMMWSEINFDDALWSLSEERTKNGRPHYVPLSKTVLSILIKQYKQTGEGAFVFPPTRPSKSGHLGIINKDTKLVKNLSGVIDFRPHDLRRTMATGLAKKCRVDRFMQDRILNHVDTSIGGIYDQHDYLDQKRIAMDKWDVALCGLLFGETQEKVIEFRRTRV